MDWHSLVKLYPSTILLGQLCFNIIVRIVIMALSWGALLAVNICLSWLIDSALGAFGASETVKDISSTVVLVPILVLAVATALTSLKDIWDLILASLRKSSVNEPGHEQGERIP